MDLKILISIILICALVIFIYFSSKYTTRKIAEDRKKWDELCRKQDEFDKKMMVNGVNPSNTGMNIIRWKNDFVTYVFNVPKGINYEILSPEEFKEKYPDMV